MDWWSVFSVMSTTGQNKPKKLLIYAKAQRIIWIVKSRVYVKAQSSRLKAVWLIAWGKKSVFVTFIVYQLVFVVLGSKISLINWLKRCHLAQRWASIVLLLTEAGELRAASCRALEKSRTQYTNLTRPLPKHKYKSEKKRKAMYL